MTRMQSDVMAADVTACTYEVRRDGGGRDGVTRMQSGVMTAVKNVSPVALLNSNTPIMCMWRRIPVALAKLDAPSSEVRLTLSRLDGEEC